MITVAEPSSLTVSGIALDLTDRGSGPPLLFLHGENGFDPRAPFFELLTRGLRAIAPLHPAYGDTPVPKSFNTVEDLAYLYLDLIEALGLRDVTLVGTGLGGWIAAAMAIKSTARLSRLVLANAFGIKAGGREDRDIADIFAMLPEELAAAAWHDPAKAKRDYAALPVDEARATARAVEATARYGWSPYMHDPKLKGRLHRIDVPTLVLWGASDTIVSADYGRAYAAAIPGARFVPIEAAGHFPHIEQPEDFARQVLEFVKSRGES